MKVKKINARLAVVQLSETVDVEDSPALIKLLEALYNDGILEIHLDFTATTFMRKSCLGPLVIFHNKLKKQGGELKIINVTASNVRHLFDMLELGRIISIE